MREWAKFVNRLASQLKQSLPAKAPRRRIAFTLVELLVVIGIIAVLISLLIPALGRVRAQSQTVACGSNLRQLGLAFSMYCHDNKGRLPSYADGTLNLGWYNFVGPYLGRRDKDRSMCSFGYNGINPGIGPRFMACPSREPDARFDQTYGVVVYNIFSYYLPNDPNWTPDLQGSAKLSQIPARVYIAADGRDLRGFSQCVILNPLGSGSWNLTVDTDKDTVLDSASGEIFGGVGPYNGWYPLHNKGANCLYADGSVRWIRRSSWAKNEDGMWGKGLPYDVYK
jgi:prepilin-type processing-associated H-X9-DG protein